MIYNLYRKANGDDAGQVLGIVGHDESDVIDAFEVYRITNIDPISVEVFKGKDIKVYGAGRPLWSEITWTPNEKWEVLNTEMDLAKIADALKADPSTDEITPLIVFFGK